MDSGERLRHAATTASNDDYSKAETVERSRHVERVDAMLAGADEIGRLRAALGAIIDLDHHNHGPESRATTIARAAYAGESTTEGKR